MLRKQNVITVFLTLLFCLQLSWCQDANKNEKLIANLEMWKAQAEAGEVKAMLLLAAYERFALKNDRNALTWYQKAAETKDIKAVLMLADIYRYRKCGLGHSEGEGGLRYDQLVVDLYVTACDAGSDLAALYLAQTYRHEWLGVKKDDKKSIEYYILAANRGNIKAAKYLVYVYQCGTQGVTKDDLKSKKWLEITLSGYRTAAENGDQEAMMDLAEIYAKGMLGIGKNQVEAQKWYRKASEHGNEKATAILNSFPKKE